MNPQSFFKLMTAREKFRRNHPKFASFFKDVITGGVAPDTIIEISVQKPGQDKLFTNMKVTESDLELLEELKNISMQQ